MGRHPALLEGLDGHEGFYRDAAIGRLFHRGSRSYRQRAHSDSVHVTVYPDNRVSVHVDRLSPLVVRSDRRCRYSVLRALAHNAVAVVEAVGHVLRGRWGRQRCELDCRIVWVPDDPNWVEPPEDDGALDDEEHVA